LNTWTGFLEGMAYKDCELSRDAAPGFLSVPYCGDGGAVVGSGPP
jgi:hypothetical protein